GTGAASGGKGGSSGSTSGGNSTSGGQGSSKAGGSPGGSNPLGIGGEGTTRVGGRITAPSAGGVKVTIAPTSLVSAAAEGAKAAGGSGITTAALITGPSASGDGGTGKPLPDGKVYAGEAGASLDPQLTAAIDPSMSTTTTPDGSWAFSQVPVPGTFLVTFSKAGYASAKYVVTTSNTNGVTLDASLAPGDGSLSGAVRGPHGPLGGATVAITDGTVNLTTRTPSTGAGVGTWSAAGLSTPDTYLITITDPGFGTQTQVVTLGAAGSRSGLDVTMSDADGDITGTVTSSAGPVGGVTVTASGGGTTVTATTSTVAPIGTYTLPDLPMPGTYTLSVSGEGWLAQTRRVSLPGSGKVNPFLTASTGDVGGTVTLGATDVRQSGVGLILSDRAHVYKTLTTDNGGFELQGIPPGNYLLSAEYFGFQSRSAEVTVRAGAAPAVINFHLPANGTTSQDQGTIQGLALDLFTSKPAVGIDISVDGHPVRIDGRRLVTSGEGTYVVHGLLPGLHQVELVDSNTNPKKGSVDLQATDVQVDVPLDGIGVAPTALMDKLDNYSGNVVSDADGSPIAGATVSLLRASSDHAAVAGVAPATTKTNGSFALHGIPAGNYEVSVTGPHHADGSDDYGSSTFPLTMAPDVDLQQQVVRLTLLPSFQVVTDQVDAAGTGYGPISGVCVTLTDNTTGATQSKYTGEFQGDGDELFFGGLDGGVSYTATYAKYTSGTCRPTPQPETAIPTTFTAVANNTSVQQVFVAAKVPALTVPLTYTTVTASGTGTCPVETGLVATDAPCTSPTTMPTVTLTGVSGFDSAGNPTDVTLTAAYCGGQSPCPPADAGTWLFAKADLAKLVGPSATLSIGGDPNTFQPQTKTVQLATTTSLNVPVTLSPMPLSISGSGPSIPNLHATVVPSTVTVTGEGSNLVWSQPPESTGEALPGTYQVTYSAPDYEGPNGAPSVTQQLAIGLCDGVGCAAPQPLDDSALVHQPTLNVTPTGLPPTATATVSLYFDGNPITGVAPQQIQAGGTATFNGLSPSKQAGAESKGEAGYGYSITSDGSFPYYSPDDTANPGSDPFHTITEPNAADLNETPGLTAVPSITGTVTGTIGGTTSPVGGATVTATLQGGCPAAQRPPDLAFAPNGVSNTFPATLTATTSTVDGGYTIVGTIGGATNTMLCPGGTYTVGVQDAGYQPDSQSVTAAQTGPVTQGFTIQATTIAQPITVTGPNGSQLPATLPVTVIAIPTSGSNFYFNTAFGSGATTCGNFSFTSVGTSFCAAPLDPVPYTYEITAPGYEPLTLPLILYSPGSCPSGTCGALTESLSPDQSTIGGTASLAGGTAVPGLKLDLDVAGDNPPVVAATTTTVTTAQATSSSPAGSFTFTAVPDGSYYITPDPSTGYSLPGPPTTFQTQYPTALKEGVTVQGTPVNVDVTADVGQLKDPNLAQATVTLTPDPSGSVAAGCAAKPADGSSNPTSECTGADPLLATGAATGPVSGQLSGSGTQWTTQIPTVTPDVYRMTISGTGIPSQAAIIVRVGPDTSGTDNLAFNVLEGEISGTVTWDATLQSTSPTITVNGTGNTTPTINCSTGSCTYSTYVPLGSSFTVS
ncbi:MAG TPA: carboxypeptidase-like regulatory domain-containing protein, partial [Acidimicrobiales bacterium]|nr:carboxypeptidase-like regulatory domain-containing protein [Acidimicrobiales bacterium]